MMTNHQTRGFKQDFPKQYIFMMASFIVAPQKETKGEFNVFHVLMLLLLAAQEASCLRLEGDDDDCQFEVSLLFQLGQNPRPEEHLALADTIQVRV